MRWMKCWRKAAVDRNDIDAVMIGTTQFTNAVIQRRDLAPTAIIQNCVAIR